MLTGLSLSYCVKDIVRGAVKLAEVEKIVSATNAPDQATFDEIIASYRESYWIEFPDQAEQIARTLWNAGKIDQPLTRGEEAHNIAKGHWIRDGQVVRLR